MKDHHIVFSLLTFCGVKSDSVSGKMRLYLKTLKKNESKRLEFHSFGKGVHRTMSFHQMAIQF